MKRKVDYTFVTFILIIIAGVIYLSKVRHDKLVLQEKSKLLLESMDAQAGYINQLEANFFENCKNNKLEYFDYNSLDIVHKKICKQQKIPCNRLILYCPFLKLDSTKSKKIKYILKSCKKLAYKNPVLVSGKESIDMLSNLLKSSDYKYFFPTDILKMKEDFSNKLALLYVTDDHEIKAYLKLSNYNLRLLNKYLRLLKQVLLGVDNETFS